MKLSEWLDQQQQYTHYTLHTKGPLNRPEFKYSICVHPKGFSGQIPIQANELDPELPDSFFQAIKDQHEITQRVKMHSVGMILPKIKGM